MEWEKVPQIIPLDQLESRIEEIRHQLQRRPMVLTQKDRAVAVLVEPQAWNRLLEELENLEDTLLGLTAYEAAKQEPSSLRRWAEVREELASEGILDSREEPPRQTDQEVTYS